MRLPETLQFPNPVNEKAARTVAAGVSTATLAALATGWFWLSIPIALGFVARVAAGPRFSPLGQFATRVAAPRLGPPKLVPGPPKRFAQAIGATLSIAAALSWSAGVSWLTVTLLVLLVIGAVLEAGFAICLGCIVFGWLMRAGLIPADTCEACNTVGLRLQQAR